MSSDIRKLGEFERRGSEYGAELAAALALAGNRAEGEGQVVTEMAAVAVGEIRAAVEYLRTSGLPDAVVADYEHACRRGFREELLRLTGRVHIENTTDAGRIAA